MEDKIIKRKGGIRFKKGSIILTIYSMPFARFLLLTKRKKLNISYIDNSFIVEQGNSKKIRFERVKKNHPLCIISVTKFIPLHIKNKLKKLNKQKSLEVIIKDIVSEEELLEYNNRVVRLPKNVSTNIPEQEKLKVGCFISCFRNKSSFNYRLSIRHRILEEIALRKEKVTIARNDQGSFIITKNSDGRSFSFYRTPQGYPLAYLSLPPSLINEEEKKIFGEGRRCISLRAYLSSKEFELDISKFFVNKEERELAYALMARNINIRIPEMRKREADIVLEQNIQLEITRLKPRKESSKNSPHTEGVYINARLCEGFLRAMNGIVPFYFVVFDKRWLKFGWVRDLINEVKPKVISILTDFEENWQENVAEKIKNKLKELKIK